MKTTETVEVDMTLAIFRYDIFSLPDGYYAFDYELPCKGLLLRNIGNNRAVFVEEKLFERMIATGQAVRKNAMPKETD